VIAGATAQFGLAAAAWTDLARRARRQVRGPKWRWAALIGVNYVGPIAYFRWGRRRPRKPNWAAQVCRRRAGREPTELALP
jgi:Phospholipase_D-nuclease N-terminal